MVHGVSKNADLDPALLAREVRPLGQRIKDTISNLGGAAVAMFGLSAVVVPFLGYASLSDWLLFVGLILLLWTKLNRKVYPLRRPWDPSDLDPRFKNKKKYKSKAVGDGLFIVGSEIGSGDGVWVNNDDVRTHMLVFGSTGSGKTRFLLSMFYQALLIGSGVMYVDGKGDTTVFGLVFSLVRRLGREDDLLVINYLTGSKTPNLKPDGTRLSNTTNPFAYGPAEQLRSLIVSLMRDSGGDDMWKGRASALLVATLYCLCYMRDRGDFDLDISLIGDYLPLDRVLELTQRDDIPEHALVPLKKYLYSLPGYAEEDALAGNLNPKAYEQHGYLTMQLTEVMADLSSTYSHIFGAQLGEVDYKDLVYNRRILFVMLPALEKDPDALSSLGKLVVAGVRSALAPALGEKVEGSHEEVILAKPTSSNVPFLLILDEYGYYSVKGFSVVAAQARSLGVAVVFAGQDLPSFKKGGEDEAKSVIANTNIKIFMKLEDSGETLQLAVERGGEADTVQTAGHEVKGEVFSNYADNMQARVERRKRINVRDLVEQKPGQAHVIFGDKLFRCNLFFADPEDSAEYRINRMLMVSRPNKEIVDRLNQSREIMGTLFSDNGADTSKLGVLELDGGLKALFNGFAVARKRDEDIVNSAKLAFGLMEYKEQLIDDAFVAQLLGPNAPVRHPEAVSVKVQQPGENPDDSIEATAEKVLGSLGATDSAHYSESLDSEMGEELDHGMPFIRDDFTPDESIKAAAKEIHQSLTEVINANIQQQIDSSEIPVSPAQQAEATPESQLLALERERGGHVTDEDARNEARRGLQLIDQKIQYPSEPQPARIQKDAISNTLSELMKSVKQADEGDE